MPRKTSSVVQLLLLLGLLAAAGGLWFARDEVGSALASLSGADGNGESGGARSKGGNTVPVIARPVGRARDDELVTAIGTARAMRSVTIYPETAGIVMALDVKAGDRVKKGDVILQLDAAKAGLAVLIAKSKLEDAQRKNDRATRLERRGVASDANTEDTQNLVVQAELAKRQAEETLKDHRIVAPFSGIVGIPKVEVGDRVETDTPTMTLDARDELLIEFEVAEKFASRLSAGPQLAAMTPSHPGQRFTGRISYIDSRIDATTRSVTVRAVLPNEGDLLRPGMSFAIEFTLPGDEFDAVPELALQRSKSESYVWIVREGKARKIAVETIRRSNGVVLVRGELVSGDLVVVEGVQRLRPGREVELLNADGSPAAGSSEQPAAARSSGEKPS